MPRGRAFRRRRGHLFPELHEGGPGKPERGAEGDEDEEVHDAEEEVAAGLWRENEGGAAFGADERGVAGDLDVVAVVREEAAGVVRAFADCWAHRAENKATSGKSGKCAARMFALGKRAARILSRPHAFRTGDRRTPR